MTGQRGQVDKVELRTAYVEAPKVQDRAVLLEERWVDVVRRGKPTRRRTWTVNRSPHVFGASKESYGRDRVETVFTCRGSARTERAWRRGRVDHRVPGGALSWKVTYGAAGRRGSPEERD